MSLRAKVASNFLGAGYTTALQFFSVPFLLKYLGAEAFGLVGVFSTMLAIVSLLELGLGASLTRELARLSMRSGGDALMRSTVRTLEIIFFGLAALIAVVLLTGAPFVGKYWLKGSLPPETLTTALLLISLQLTVNFPLAFYNAGLMGLQRVGDVNLLQAVFQTVRIGGGLFLAVTAVNPLIPFFVWQVVATLLHMLAARIFLHIHLPKGEAKFSNERWKECREFALGMSSISLATVSLTQLDKIVLSKMLSLEQFGVYMLAFNIAILLLRAPALVMSATLPRMTQLASSGDTEALKIVYSKFTMACAWLCIPVAVVVGLWVEPLLALYLMEKSAVLTDVAPLVCLLLVGNALNGVLHSPFALTLAYGWTRFAFWQNIIACFFLIPTTIFLVSRSGAFGAAWSWNLLNIGYLAFTVFAVHRRLLVGQAKVWWSALLWPSVAGIVVLGVRHLLSSV